MFLTNKYTKWYFQIIYKANGSSRCKGSSEYFEEHHIRPTKLGGSNYENNLVFLTAREHFIVHWLLTKCLEGEDKAKMVCAFWNMVSYKNDKRNYSSRYYEIARKKFVEQLSLNLPEDEIIDLYKQGLSTAKIAKKFNCTGATIRNFLKRNNVKMRTISEANLGKSKLNDFKDEIIDLYITEGLSTLKIAEKFNCSDVTIGRLLKSNNIILRTNSEARLGNSKLYKYKDEIIDLYTIQGLSTVKIAEKFNCSHVSIGTLLSNNNVKIRTIGEAKLGNSKLYKYKDKIIDLYVNQGLSTYKIAKKFECSDVSIGNLLKKNNIKMR